MQGLRVHSNERFAALFAPLWPKLRGHSWLALCDAFQFPEAWLDRSAFDDASETYTAGPCWEFERDVRLVGSRSRRFASELGYYSTADLFPKYAPAMSDDGCAVFGLAAPLIDPSVWLEEYYTAKDRAAYLQEHAQVCFLNDDGQFWAVYAHDADLIATARTHLQALTGTAVRGCRLEDHPL